MKLLTGKEKKTEKENIFCTHYCTYMNIYKSENRNSHFGSTFHSSLHTPSLIRGCKLTALHFKPIRLETACFPFLFSYYSPPQQEAKSKKRCFTEFGEDKLSLNNSKSLLPGFQRRLLQQHINDHGFEIRCPHTLGHIA